MNKKFVYKKILKDLKNDAEIEIRLRHPLAKMDRDKSRFFMEGRKDT